jgi:hypothetical protein
MGLLIIGILFCLISAFCAYEAFIATNVDLFIGSLVIGLFFLCVGIPAFIVGAKRIGGQSEADLKSRKKCPHCAEMIKAEAKICRYCGRDPRL